MTAPTQFLFINLVSNTHFCHARQQCNFGCPPSELGACRLLVRLHPTKSRYRSLLAEPLSAAVVKAIDLRIGGGYPDSFRGVGTVEAAEPYILYFYIFFLRESIAVIVWDIVAGCTVSPSRASGKQCRYEYEAWLEAERIGREEDELKSLCRLKMLHYAVPVDVRGRHVSHYSRCCR